MFCFRDLKPPILAALGNPLLDICVKVSDDDFFINKYELERDGQKQIDSSVLRNILNDLKAKNLAFECSPGGTSQNTLRVFQWLINEPNYTVYFGAVGNDDHGALMQEKVEKDSVTTRYAKKEEYSTGTCISFINGVTRTLAAHLGAANTYPATDFNITENTSIFSNLHMLYIEGFFIIHDLDTAVKAVALCHKNGVAVVFNLSGVYILEEFYNEVLYMLSISDITIGNKTEYGEIGKYYNKEHRNIKEIMHEVKTRNVVSKVQQESDSQLGLKSKLKNRIVDVNRKIVIVTQNKDPTLCLFGNNEYVEVEVESIDESLIIDTTAAGDSFAAGFLAGIVMDKSIRESIQLGNQAARYIIQQVGCTLPANKFENDKFVECS